MWPRMRNKSCLRMDAETETERQHILKGEEMTRAEHLKWCKERALEYVKLGNLNEALASMTSDLGKHPETRSSVQFCVMLGMSETSSPERMKRFIEGFN